MSSKKFYAVHRGRIPGVYTSWEETQDQIHKFPGAAFAKFTTFAEASSYVQSGVKPIPSKEKPKKQVYYAVRYKSRKGEVFTDWGQVDRHGCQVKKFGREEDARAWIRCGGSASFLLHQEIASELLRDVYTDGSVKDGAMAIGVHFRASVQTLPGHQ